MYSGELGDARSRLRHALAQARRGGDPLSTGVLFALSRARARRALPDALERDRGLTASEQTDQRDGAHVLLFAQALAEAHSAWPTAAGRAREGLAIAERVEHRLAAAQNRWALGLPRASAGQADAAWAALEPAIALLREGGVGEPAWTRFTRRRSTRC